MPRFEGRENLKLDITLNFVGPFSFSSEKKSLFKSECAQSAGIYLWTIKQKNDNSFLIHYVGETTNFSRRHREHLIHILGLNYGIFDPEKAQNGICKLIWPGLWRDKSNEAANKLIKAYEGFRDTVLRYIAIIDIFFAEIHVETQLRKHIEGCIGWNLRNNHPNAKNLYPDDNHIGTKKEKNRGNLIIQTSNHIKGLDSIIAY